MNVTFVTSFNTEAVYAAEFMRTWNRYNYEVPLWLYYDGGWPAEGLPKPAPNTLLFDLDGHANYLSFKGRWAGNMYAAGGPWGDYRWAGLRFAPKVFAYTEPHRPATDWWCWIDADAVFKKPFDDNFFRRACPDAAIMSWLERPGWGYCEAGWLAFRHQHPAMMFLLAEMRRLYTEDRLWSYHQWHDAYLLQRVIDTRLPGWKHEIQSLSDGSMKQLHPWPETILSDYVTHKKGNAKNA